jgi:predicted SnoaL-like aldol condensation-catalyzing enzyme
VLTTTFGPKDFAALERYLHPDYVQHNSFIPPKRDGLRSYVAGLSAETGYELGAIIAEGELVMVHGRYAGATERPLLAMDIFRFQDGLVVEHWDVLKEEVPTANTVAGNPMFTNPQGGSVG